MPRRCDANRRALPVGQWPESDKQAWAAALAAGDVFEGGGRAAHWAERTKLTNIQHYGRWLGFLGWAGGLDGGTSPADRVTRERARAYDQHLQQIVAPRTRLSMLVGLKVMMQAMAPRRDWDWLQRACNRIQLTAKPRADKRSRMRPTRQIVGAALRELKKLPADPLSFDNALRYRDAFMLAFLAVRPLRVKNFGSLECGRHLVHVEKTWLINIPATETKNHQPLNFYFPDALLPWFERYLKSVRPLFPDAKTSNRLWLSKNGACAHCGLIHYCITRLTRQLFGVAINPHLLRDCAATSLAEGSVAIARSATSLLGHGHVTTTERFYIQENNIAASRRINSVLRKVKSHHAALRQIGES